MLKTITVKNLVLQFDSKKGGENAVQEAHEVIDLINKIIGMSELEAQPQILSGALDNDDVSMEDSVNEEED